MSFILFTIFGCKDFFKLTSNGHFQIVNTSDKVVEFVWITPEGELFPTAQNININKDDTYDIYGLDQGFYDIAIDFKDEYNSFNSKKDKNLCLYIEKGTTTILYIDPKGNISYQ